MATTGSPRYGPPDGPGFIEVMNRRIRWRAAAGFGGVAIALLLPRVTAAQEQLLWVDGPAGRLRVSDGGNGGVPVVFVHGLAGDRTHWKTQLEHLRPNRRAIAFDMRGHGESDKPDGADYSIDGIAADVEAVVDALAVNRFVLVGHSFGAGVVAAYAGANPDRVAGLFFADPIGDQRTASMQIQMLVQMLQSPSYQTAALTYYEAILFNAAPGVREQVLESLNHTSQAALVQAFQSMTTFDPVATLTQFPGPMFNAISDLNDFPFSLHNVVKDLPTERMSATSHWLQMDKPEECNGFLDRFLLESN